MVCSSHYCNGLFYFRQMKQKKVSYFSHDANARRDLKIMKMRGKYKYGYQWYFMTLEVMREQKDYRLPIDAIEILAFELQEDYDLINNWLNDCITHYNLFLRNARYIWSPSFLARMKLKDNISEVRSKLGKEGYRKRQAIASEKLSNSLPLASEKSSNSLEKDKQLLEEIQASKESKESKVKKESEGKQTDGLKIDNTTPNQPPTEPITDLFTKEQLITSAVNSGYTKELGVMIYNHYKTQDWTFGNGRPISPLSTPDQLVLRYAGKGKQMGLKVEKGLSEEEKAIQYNRKSTI